MSRSQRFETEYFCFSMAVIDRYNADDGDKIILPQSAFEALAQMNIEFPMKFRIENPQNKKFTHCGVLEFSGREGNCFLPYWMMENLNLTENSLVKITNVSLSKATFVKLKPLNLEFLELSNPRSVLEVGLRKFTCLTVGDVISIESALKFRVIETKPTSAVSIVETDCQVDFEEPEGYKESKYYEAETRAKSVQEKVPQAARIPQRGRLGEAEEKKPSFAPFSGAPKRIDGKAVNSDSGALPTAPSTPSTTSNTSTHQISYQSRIGDRFSKIKTNNSAFSGTANKLS